MIDTMARGMASENAAHLSDIATQIGTVEKIDKQLFGIHIAAPTDTFTDCGQGALRIFCSWKTIETSKGVFDWSRLDDYVDYADNNGLKILYILGSPPNWATTPNNYGIWDTNPYIPDNDQDIIDFLTVLIGRYGKKIQYFEGWNEPDSATFTYPSYLGTMSQLAHWMQVVYPTIKFLNPDAKILSPSFCSSPVQMGEFLDAGGKGYFDIAAIHLYVDPNPPEFMLKSVRDFKSTLITREIYCPIWNTEAGYGSYVYNGTTYPSGWSGGAITVMPDSMAIAYISRFYLCCLYGGFESTFYYMSDSTQNTLRLFDPTTFSITTAGQVVKKLSSILVGAIIIDKYYKNNAYVIAIRKDGLDYIITWTTDETNAYLNLQNESIINYAEDMTGNMVYPYNSKLPIGSSPIIIHVNSNNTYSTTAMSIIASTPITGNLVNNGNFTSGNSGWDVSIAGTSTWSYVNNMLNLTCKGANDTISQMVTVQPNTKYTLSFTLDSSHNTVGNSFVGYAYFNSSYGFISGNYSISGNSYTFTTPYNCKFVQIIVCTGGLTGNQIVTVTDIALIPNPDTIVLSDIQNYTTVSAVSNTYNLNLQNKQITNFAITTADTVAKTVTFSNVLSTTGRKIFCEIFLTYTNAANLTFPASAIWKDNTVPTFVAGKRYKLFFETYDNGTTWLASYVGAW